MKMRWWPKERLGRQALAGLLIWAVCGVAAAGLGTMGDTHFRWHDREGNAVTRAVLQYGATSPEADAAIQAMGAQGGSGTVIALIDPTTGTAVAAFPKDLTGKKPEEIAVGGVRLPQLSYLQQHEPKHEGERDSLMLEVTPVGFDGRADGRGAGREGGHGKGRAEGRNRQWGRHEGEQGKQKDGQTPGTTTTNAARPLLVVAAPKQAPSATLIAAGALAAVAGLGFVLYWLSVAWWAFKDAQARRKPAIAWGLLVLVTNLVGVVIYLLARNVSHDCPHCGAQTGLRFTYCPECGHSLKATCAKCGKKLKAGWHYCAACGTPRTTEGDATTEE